MLTALAAVLGGPVPGQPARPFLTFYDDATGERTELSYATTENWVAKTANCLRDGLGVAPGDRVRVDPGVHWRRVVETFACWAVAALPSPEGTAIDDDVAAYGDLFQPIDPPSTPRAEPDPRRVMVVDDDPVPAALAALAGGGSVVIVVHADPAALGRRAEMERVTG